MIGIIFCNDLNMCPYIDKYLSVFDELNVDYEIIIWNRMGGERVFPDNFKVYNEQSDIYASKIKKIGAFYRFGRFLNRTIKGGKYDKLVVLTTLPGILCYKTLIKKYRKKFIFDFRDLGFEKNCIYRNLVKKICKASFFTCISSPGFREILGENNFVIAHNFRYKDIENKVKTIQQPKERINLLHIGITRGEDYNKRIADIFGNDERFQINIVGSGNDTETFLKYVQQFSNISVVGRYDNIDKQTYIKNADMLLYYYPCDFNCNRALANKYYDGLIYKKPLIGNIKTYSGKRLQEKGIGISLDLADSNFANKVYDYMSHLNYDEYLHAAEDEFSNVLLEDKLYLARIEEFAREKIN